MVSAATPPADTADKPIPECSRDELRNIGRELELPVTNKLTKEQLLTMIQEHLNHHGRCADCRRELAAGAVGYTPAGRVLCAECAGIRDQIAPAAAGPPFDLAGRDPRPLDGMKEICGYIHRSESTVLDWTRRLQFPARKEGGIWITDKNLVDDWRAWRLTVEK